MIIYLNRSKKKYLGKRSANIADTKPVCLCHRGTDVIADVLVVKLGFIQPLHTLLRPSDLA